MPLRRVTLSGRLARYESDSPEEVRVVLIKGIAAVVLDIAIGLALAIFSFMVFMGKMVAPYERGFYCREVNDLSYPFYPNTVKTGHLLVVSLGFPFFVIFLAEAIFFRHAGGSNRLRKYFSAVTSTYLEYLATFTLATFTMEAFKCGFARLRPHYLSVCKPDWSLINCTDPDTFIENAHCTNPDTHRIRVGRTSFPSGHTAAAVHLFTFIYFYLTGLVRSSDIQILRRMRALLLLVVGAWTLLVATTRITDYWHHPTDVLGGVVLGFSSIYFPVLRRKDPSLVYEYRLLERPHST